MEVPKILVVEDDSEIRSLIASQLSKDQYNVEEVENGEQALTQLNEKTYDLIILDWMLPGLDGVDLARQIKTSSERIAPSILMVTAKAEPQNIIQGLEAGADDYVTKPFDLAVLKARVKALLRRRQVGVLKASDDHIISLGDISVNTKAHEVTCKGEPVSLTISEFKLLKALAENKGRVLTRDHLIELVQGEGVVVIDRTVDTHVFGLRKKLGKCSDVIETVRGVGYRISGGE